MLGEVAEAHLAPVEVLDDGQVQLLLALPLGLHGVAEELAQGPVRPLQQLVIQQEGVCGLCRSRGATVSTAPRPAAPAARLLPDNQERTLFSALQETAEGCPGCGQPQENGGRLPRKMGPLGVCI